MQAMQTLLPFYDESDYYNSPISVSAYFEGYVDTPRTQSGPIEPPPAPPTQCEHCLLPHHHEELDAASRMCERCHETFYASCVDCGDIHQRVDMTEKDYDCICNTCINDYFECADCDTLTPHIECHHGDVCDSCGEHYWYCDRCDEYVHENDYYGDRCCNDCHESESEDEDDDCDDTIDDYHHTRGMRKFGPRPKDALYYGIELEFECESGCRRGAASHANDIMGSFAEIKADGSLNNGFEIATAPATPKVHAERWEKFFSDLPDVTAEDTCGMHVHASREGISPLTLGKLLVFYNRKHNRRFVKDQAGREGIYNGSYDPHKKVSDGKYQDGNRYQAINTSNYETIEFRIFAGTTSRRTFFANFEFVQATILFCKLSGINDLTHEAFCKWVASRGKSYPNLHKRLREQKYVAVKAHA